MLPAESYTSAEAFDEELDRLYERSWVHVGRAADLAEVGAQRAVRAGREPVLLVRDEGGVRAWFDVCRHRGHELLAIGEEACRGVIRCPYHAWTYRLDGTLRATAGEEVDVDPSTLGLVPVPLVEWHGWLFANPSADAAPFDVHAGNLAEVVAPYGPASLVPAERHQYEVAANWKLLVENYHECFHCPSIHPELCRVSPPSSGRSLEAEGNWVGGPMDLAEAADTMSFSGRSGGEPLAGLDARQRREVQYLGLLPNLLLSLHPDYVMTHRLEPLDPGRTAVTCEWLGPPGVDLGYAVEFWDRTNRQDWAACESVQRGVGSRGWRPAVLTERERDVRRFVELVSPPFSARLTPGSGGEARRERAEAR